jgi:hypothetical protein
MNPKLDEFFKNERKRVFEPGPYFTQRVMAAISARLPEREIGIWDGVMAGARPVFALAMVLLLGILAIQLFLPDNMPDRGPIDAVLGPEQTDGEHLIFTGTDPSVPELEKMIIITEDGQ